MGIASVTLAMCACGHTQRRHYGNTNTGYCMAQVEGEPCPCLNFAPTGERGEPDRPDPRTAAERAAVLDGLPAPVIPRDSSGKRVRTALTGDELRMAQARAAAAREAKARKKAAQLVAAEAGPTPAADARDTEGRAALSPGAAPAASPPASYVTSPPAVALTVSDDHGSRDTGGEDVPVSTAGDGTGDRLLFAAAVRAEPPPVNNARHSDLRAQLAALLEQVRTHPGFWFKLGEQPAVPGKRPPFAQCQKWIRTGVYGPDLTASVRRVGDTWTLYVQAAA